MVLLESQPHASSSPFQYSLCRVVLMVWDRLPRHATKEDLSVLALSSRFDGQTIRPCAICSQKLSVLALSSRFDGLL